MNTISPFATHHLVDDTEFAMRSESISESSGYAEMADWPRTTRAENAFTTYSVIGTINYSRRAFTLLRVKAKKLTVWTINPFISSHLVGILQKREDIKFH